MPETKEGRRRRVEKTEKKALLTVPLPKAAEPVIDGCLNIPKFLVPLSALLYCHAITFITFINEADRLHDETLRVPRWIVLFGDAVIAWSLYQWFEHMPSRHVSAEIEHQAIGQFVNYGLQAEKGAEGATDILKESDSREITFLEKEFSIRIILKVNNETADRATLSLQTFGDPTPSSMNVSTIEWHPEVVQVEGITNIAFLFQTFNIAKNRYVPIPTSVSDEGLVFLRHHPEIAFSQNGLQLFYLRRTSKGHRATLLAEFLPQPTASDQSQQKEITSPTSSSTPSSADSKTLEF